MACSRPRNIKRKLFHVGCQRSWFGLFQAKTGFDAEIFRDHLPPKSILRVIYDDGSVEKLLEERKLIIKTTKMTILPI